MATASAGAIGRPASTGKRASGAYSVGVARVPHDTAAATRLRLGHQDAVQPGGVVRRLFGSATRIVGVDAARGVAVVMLVAGGVAIFAGSIGLGDTPAAVAISVLDPESWLVLARGGSLMVLSALGFVFVAGISISLISGGYEGSVGFTAVRARLRILVRVIVFAAFGLVTLATGYGVGHISTVTPIDASGIAAAAPAASASSSTVVAGVVPYALLAAGLLFFVSTLSLFDVLLARCGSALLFAVAGACAVVVPIASTWLDAAVSVPALRVVVIFLPWVGLFPAGMAVGRMRLELVHTRLMLLIAGVVLACGTFGSAWALQHFIALPGEFIGYTDSDSLLRYANGGVAALAADGPPSIFVVVGVCGALMAVVAALLLVGHPLRWVVLPLAALGSLAQTMGGVVVACACLATVAATGSPIASHVTSLAELVSGGHGWLLTVEVLVVVMVLATLWRLAFAAGPLERLTAGLTALLCRGTRESLREAVELERRDEAAGMRVSDCLCKGWCSRLEERN